MQVQVLSINAKYGLGLVGGSQGPPWQLGASSRIPSQLDRPLGAPPYKLNFIRFLARSYEDPSANVSMPVSYMNHVKRPHRVVTKRSL